jgi:hypothetical protein
MIDNAKIKDLGFISKVRAKIERRVKGVSSDFIVVKGEMRHVGRSNVCQDVVLYKGKQAGTLQFICSRKTGKVTVVLHGGVKAHIGSDFWKAIEEAYRDENPKFKVSRKV